MKNYIWVLMVVVLNLAMLYDAANALDRGWNYYSCWEFRLTFEYPAFLNTIEVRCSRGDSPKQWESCAPEITKLWPWKNCRHGISFSVSDDSGRNIGVMSVSVYDNPDGYDLWRCATELATFRIDEPTREGHRVEYDSLLIGEADVIHVRSYNRWRGNEVKWANLYVLQSQTGQVFSVYMDDACMNSALTDEYGDYNYIVNRIISSIKWVK
jgi:hypothetical protein